MTSREEREEVANKLRGVRITRRKNEDDILPGYIALCQAVGGKKDPWYGIYALCSRLADLIDPTCMVAYVKGKAICCNCGNDEVFDDYLYCPRCGARLMRYDL